MSVKSGQMKVDPDLFSYKELEKMTKAVVIPTEVQYVHLMSGFCLS